MHIALIFKKQFCIDLESLNHNILLVNLTFLFLELR